MNERPAVWFPTVQTGTGTDIFTIRLAKILSEEGIQTEITWLPLRAEYAPWSVATPKPPKWANIVHINTWLHPRFIPAHLPVVATIHHAVHHPDAMSYKGWLRAAYHKYWIAPIERKVIKRADQVIAVSQFVADTTQKTLVNVPMQVIYNGIDTEIFKPGNRTRQPGEPFRLLYVGSWITRKGVDLLAPIMNELGEGFELYYTGGSAAEKDKPQMPSNMIDIGRLQGDAAVAKAMQNADALLFPSRSEGHPLVAIEAVACGLTVVAMDGTSIVEVIKDQMSGVLCRQNDIKHFSDTIRKLASTAGKAQYTIQKKPQKAFSEKKMLQEYLTIYMHI